MFCGKTRHPTAKDARRHMVRQMQLNGKKYGKVRVYHCKLCGHWHFGHKAERKAGKHATARAKIVTKETVHG